MNHDQLNEFLAVKVMKAALTEDNKWEKPDGYIICHSVVWDPAHDIAQALMCLNTFKRYKMIKHSGWITVTVEDVSETNINEPLAISLACARAAGYEG